ncbi:hypothetical protein C4D60_Mb01t11430 [Musa balbisiana]|uniref:Uncharacterized protein n=1 Tax=Musa balbisiana TaxID=52838 RepID=A0A4S8JLQ7_MUSBA|nr:hypothetical protein C4D60_Mb01t11430 [Musa balbisiana]
MTNMKLRYSNRKTVSSPKKLNQGSKIYRKKCSPESLGHNLSCSSQKMYAFHGSKNIDNLLMNQRLPICSGIILINKRKSYSSNGCKNSTHIDTFRMIDWTCKSSKFFWFVYFMGYPSKLAFIAE